MKLQNPRINTLLFSIIFFGISCANENIDRPLTVRLEKDPESLNPIIFNHISTRQIFDLVYQSLYAVTLPDGVLKPILAEGFPHLNETDSGFYLTITIRENARWDEENPVTSNDIAFTLKILNLPGGEGIGITNHTSIIENYIINDPKRITFKLRHNYHNPLLIFDEFYIYPEHLMDVNYDLKGLQLDDVRENKSPEITALLIEKINTINFIENKELLIGSNAYSIANWHIGQQVILSKKRNYWFEGEKDAAFKAVPDTIIFQIIPNPQSAITALQNHQIDVLSGLSPHDYIQLKNALAPSDKFQFFEVGSFDLTFFGSNGRKPPFDNIYFRKGLAWLIPYEDIIEHGIYGIGERTVAFVYPHQKLFYHVGLPPRTFNADSAIANFKLAGWELKNGKLTKNNEVASFDLYYRKMLKDHETTAFLMKDSMRKGGININMVPLDGNLMNQKLSDADFDLFLKRLSGGPNAYDYEFILHTNFAPPNGWNYSSFGTDESDSLIYVIRNAVSDQERKNPLLRFQEILFNECNVVTLYNEKHTIIVNSKYENLHISSLKPGYTLSTFKARNK